MYKVYTNTISKARDSLTTRYRPNILLAVPELCLVEILFPL